MTLANVLPNVLNVPLAHEVIAVVRSTDDMIEAFRAIKGQLGLSNVLCDKLAGLAEDHTNKILGPRRVKNLGPMTFDIFCELFGVEFQMVINLDAVRRMESRWEQRNNERVRTENRRPGREVIERVRPYVMRENGRKGGLNSRASITAVEATRISLKANRARKRKLTKARRSEIAKNAANARHAKAKAGALQALTP
jgi:hypothetical protein